MIIQPPGIATIPRPRMGGGASLPLDVVTVAVAAYSTKKLRTAYAGNCLRARRSSDNAEQDIGFAGNALDTSALLSFVGANSGYITTWYDQSGAGNNFIQATASLQPRIVNAGSIENQVGGVPCLRFIGASGHRMTAAQPFTSSLALGTFIVGRSIGSAPTTGNVGLYTAWSGSLTYWPQGPNVYETLGLGARIQFITMQFNVTNCYAVNSNGANWAAYINGGAAAATRMGGALGGTPAGSLIVGQGGVAFDGWLSEMVLFQPNPGVSGLNIMGAAANAYFGSSWATAV